MKAVTTRRKAPAKMVTIVIYNPDKQEYMLLPSPAGSTAKLQAVAMAQYTEAERAGVHIVTVLDGLCVASAVYEAEVTIAQ